MENQKQLIDKLSKCIAACQNCADACLDENNISKMVPCIRLDRDCADVCQTTLNLIARNSDHASKMIEVCEELCAACAKECEKHEAQHCQDCAKACRECEEACKTAA